MSHAISLFLTLVALWLMLSGEYAWLLLALGLLSTLLITGLALRMDVVDQEQHPIHVRSLRLIGYWGWLLVEIFKANIDVTRCILHPAMPISPTVFRVSAEDLSELGQVVYANSITLTPGTVSINVEDGEIEVHALSADAAADLERGEMKRRLQRPTSLASRG